MDFNKLRPVIELTVLSLITFGMHELSTWAAGISDDGFLYSNPILYLMFYTLSLLIILILIKVRINNIDSVGNAFMGLTCFKMMIAYIMLYPILQSKGDASIERINFFVIFAVFLVIETIVAIRILNKK